MKKRYLIPFVGLITSNALAYDEYETMSIENIAVSNVSNTFVAHVDSELSNSTCSESKRFKWKLDEGSTNAIIAIVTSAFMAGKKVQFQYNTGNDNCVSNGQTSGYIKVI